jgi:outer membrane protein assembly factor BamB
VYKLLTLASVLLTAGLALAQADVRIHTTPKVPPKDVLDKLNLKVAWHTKVPTDGLRDGFYSLQLVPGPKFTLLLAQTFRGSVVAINADTGDTLWRTTVGLPYQLAQPAGWNDQAVFVCRRENLYVLDRDDGKQQLYTLDPGTNQPNYGMALEAGPSAGLVADEDYLFISYTDRVIRYYVPNFRAFFKQKGRVPEPGQKPVEPPQLKRQWNFNTYGGQLLQTPILDRNNLILIGAEGTLYVVNKFEGELVSRFQTEGPIPVPVAHNKSVLYVPSQDYFLYAVDTAKGRLLWRFAAQSQINHKPEATDRDVFVSPSKGGMFRVDRKSGDAVWKNSDAFQFLSTNERFVYALDRQGKMLVIDYERGKELARYDMRDWIVPVANDFTDRIFLASHDGQILCLHHRDLAKPMKVKTFVDLKAKEKPKKDGDKPKDDKKMPKDDKNDKGDKDDKDKDKTSQVPVRPRLFVEASALLVLRPWVVPGQTPLLPGIRACSAGG